jgi:hypothetical protein
MIIFIIKKCTSNSIKNINIFHKWGCKWYFCMNLWMIWIIFIQTNKLTSSSNFPKKCHSSNMFLKYLVVGLHKCFIFYMYWGLTQYLKVPKLVSKLLGKLGNST